MALHQAQWLEGTCASVWAGVCVSLVTIGVPVLLGFDKDVVTSTVILPVSELLIVSALLGVQLPL